MDAPVELAEDECRRLLGHNVVGRFGFTTPDGPQIIPVNYAWVSEAITIRTTGYSVLAQHLPGAAAAFEIDHLDYENQRGWSVLATGHAEHVDDLEEVAEIARTWNPRPWAGGNRPLYLRLFPERLSGRRTGPGWDPFAHLPVQRVL
ncbi:pyridoxamine 5'-phosphate oxidase family protein [Nocardioides daejeonensis]|uniref:pyridoxamine 5'-phosphate oxidase family protein n=1 Tax=Nocardioides daejeonensis TaxID=1046556 RepID=UPI000D743957|nr:pyridoxamine 5'-phosphate oxidase family protein [Nocardioides daejeonensis]